MNRNWPFGYPVTMGKSRPPKSDDQPVPFDAFRELAQKLVQVPKKEVDEREAEYQREQEKDPRRGPKSN